VLDMMMPGGLSGYDVLRELRNAAELDAVPVRARPGPELEIGAP
jgi:CheY-like chemotaxis protein